jgi:hypothetical protein
MVLFHYAAKGASVVLLILSLAVVASAQNNGIDPALLAKAKAGSATAEYQVGFDYEYAYPQDDAQAALWYRKASEQGYAPAQFFLDLDYDGGKGVPQNYTEAYFWLDVATSGNLKGIGQEDIAKWRDEAVSHLTPTELSSVQERARKWFKTQSTCGETPWVTTRLVHLLY